MNIAVLGCGPCGLLVAEAVHQLGHEPHIYSRKQRSEIPGSQHLQGYIPKVTPQYPDSAVMFVRMGTKEGYAEKVYGDPYHPSGWPQYDGICKSWSVFKAYDLLWAKWSREVVDRELNVITLGNLVDEYELILSTIPQKNICIKSHHFGGVPFWIQPRITPADDQHREVVVFNGLPDDAWYRWSILGRKESLESTTPLAHAIQGWKAIENDCDCWPEIHRLGRWAKWQHGVLLHHAFHEAAEIIAQKEGANSWQPNKI
jgi:hypothetical protein